MSGYDVAREVRQTSEKRPVLIAITGWNKPSDRILAKLVGFDHHLPKPFEAQELLALLDPLVSAANSK
jgi:two-component system CheB/CheR fusion protein